MDAIIACSLGVGFVLISHLTSVHTKRRVGVTNLQTKAQRGICSKYMSPSETIILQHTLRLLTKHLTWSTAGPCWKIA